MKTLYLIRGLPGSGKSMLAYRLIVGMFASRHEADAYHHDKDGVYNWKPENVSAAHSWCQNCVDRAMQAGQDFIAVSNTFTRQWEMEPYRELARKYGYTVTVVTVESGLDDAALAARNVHNVSAEMIARMRARWEN